MAESIGSSAEPIEVDVSDLESNRAMVATVIERTGRIDVAFLNAGYFGPMDGFAATDEELAAACDTGLSIQRVDYVRVVHPKRTLVTGSSRDATLWLEGGRAVARLPQFRFTLRLDELFSSLEAIGARRERGETAFMESVVAAGATTSSFPVDVVTG